MTATELDRDIGLWGAASLGVGSTIAGVFVLSGIAVGEVGATAVASLLLAAFAAGVTALAYAEFVGLSPESGGGYAHVANTFDTDLTYVVGWAMLLGAAATAAFYLASFAEWAHRFLLPALSVDTAVPYWTLGAGVLALLFVVNLWGTRESGSVQLLTTILQIGVVGAFLSGALQAFDPAIAAESVRGSSATLADARGIALTGGLVFLSFVGFETIANSAEEIERPARTVPRAMALSLVAVFGLSALVVLATVLAVESPEFLASLAKQAGLAGPEAARAFVEESGDVTVAYVAAFFLGDLGYVAVVAGALLAMAVAANATVVAGSRVALAMARRGHLPDAVGRLHSRTNTPSVAVLFTTALVAVAFATVAAPFGGAGGALGLETLAQFAAFALLTGVVTVNVALIASRWKRPDAERAFRVPLVPLVPALGVLACLLLLGGLERDATLLGVATLTAATVVGWPLLDAEPASTPITDRHGSPSDDAAVLVPVREAADRSLVTLGGAIAAGTGGSVVPLSVVELPSQTPPSAAEQYEQRERELLDSVAGGVSDEYVEKRVRAGHDFGRVVRNAVDDHDPDVLLLSARDAVDVCLFGGGRTLLSSLEETFDCDVCVYRPGSLQAVDSVFVGAADGSHAETSVAAAAAVARATDARLDLYRALPSDVDDETLQGAHDDLTERGDAVDDVDTRTLVEPTDEPRQAFLDRSESADLVVIGSTDGRDEDVDVAGELLRERDASTLVVQSGEGSVHLPLF